MKKNLTLFILASLSLHVLVLFIFSSYLQWHQSQSLIPIQIAETEPLPTQKSTQVVDQYQFNHQSPDDNFYLSQHNNSTAIEQKGKQRKSPNALSAQQDTPSENSLFIETSSQPMIYGNIDDLEHVKKEGDQNLLNTKETIFYTFYSRVKNQIYWHWVRDLKRNLEDILLTPHTPLPAKRFVTKTETLINSKGYPLAIIIKQKSGLEEFDKASINAIKKAHPFLNPPQSLLDNTKTFRLNHTFVFINKPSRHLSSYR